MSDERQKKKPSAPNVFSDSKLRLYTEPTEPGAKQPSLRINLYENNPRIVVDYGKQTDKGYQITHETPIDPVVLGQLVEMIRMIAKAAPDTSLELDNWGRVFMWDNELRKNVLSKDILNISRITISKQANGDVTLMYTAAKRPEVTFVFTDNERFHKLLQNGQPLANSKKSPIAALAWANAIEAVYFSYYSLKWEEPEYRKRFRLEQAAKRNGGGGGNYNNNQNRNNNQGGGNQNRAQADTSYADEGFDESEDFPFS